MHRIDLFLHCFCLIYLSAFSSILIQSKGLYGRNGILPSREALSKGDNLMLKYIFGEYNLQSDDINILIILGLVISSLAYIFSQFQTKLIFLLLWICYFSVFQIGQTFLWFQWDILLLETGIIAIILAENWVYGKRCDDSEEESSSLGFWLIKWLVFRLMFMSGVVKLTSGCPTWWGLTALDWHYESQCIPTSFAWFAHQLPRWFQKFSVASTFIIEISIPILFFIPIKPLQMFCFWSQVFFQFCIIFTGNYNFFNLLTIVLCFSLLPRKKQMKSSNNHQLFYMGKQVIEEVLAVVVILIVLFKSGELFGLSLDTKGKKLHSKIKFSRREFHEFLSRIVPITIYVGFVSMIVEMLRLYIFVVFKKGWLNKVKHFVSVSLTSIIIAFIFFTSLVPYTYLDDKTQEKLSDKIKELYNSINRYEIVNSYGLFRSMTGVGGRPEIVIEGSYNLGGPWKEYEFLYKPGNISRAPPILIPHQPRLDWQMWFAALGSYNENPWLLNLVYRLLTNESAVMELLDRNPFPQSAPHFIRVQKYIYRYTKLDDKIRNNNWWERQHVAEYLPAISLENPGFMRYIRDNNIDYNEKYDVHDPVRGFVRYIVDNLDQCWAHHFVWLVLGSSFVTKLLLDNFSVMKLK